MDTLTREIYFFNKKKKKSRIYIHCGYGDKNVLYIKIYLGRGICFKNLENFRNFTCETI